MARRMFSQEIVDTDVFLDMPQSTQLLYFHLALRADDDGFVSPKKIMRMIGSSNDDLKMLVSKRYILIFESGIVVIKHWLIHNLIRSDIYKETTYIQEKALLGLNDFGAYTEKRDGVQELKKIEPPKWLKNRISAQIGTESVQQRADVGTQSARRIGKDSKGKDSKEEKRATPDKPESSLSWLGTFNEKEEFVCGVPDETLKAFSEKYKASEEQIKNKCEDLVLWAKTSRKVKKNYKTFLQVILKKDFGIRTEADKVLEERIRLTREHGEQSSPFAQALSKKMKM